MNKVTLGQKIYKFRKRAGWSQFKLEEEIDAAPGSVSRIEADKINPTKETLIAITDALSLSPPEVSYLLGLNQADPTPDEIAIAISIVQPLLDKPEVYAYLLDHKSRFVYFSKGFQEVSKLWDIDPRDMIGKHPLEAFFDPSIGLRKNIENTERGGFVLTSILYQERDYMLDEPWWNDLIERLMKFEDFITAWDNAKKERINLVLPENRMVVFNIAGNTVPMTYSHSTLFPDSRFMLVEYQMSR